MNQTLAKKALVTAFESSMRNHGLTVAALARKLNTSRSAVDRIFDPRNTSITLRTAHRAAEALGLQLTITATPKQLGALAAQLANSKSPTQAQRLRAKITQGFYGNARKVTV